MGVPDRALRAAADLSLPERLVSIAYPLGDVLLLAVAVRLLRTGGPGVIASRLLAFGLAALHPSMVSLSEPRPRNPRLTRTQLGLLTGASLMAPAMLVIQMLREEPIDVGVIAGGSVVLFLLTLTRMGGLASEVAMQAEGKRAMQTVLRATEQERVRLAADLHDGPVQELTALRYGLTRARSRIQRGEREQAEGMLAELEDELASGITGLRRLMAELRPAVLDERGLEAALHTRCGPSRRPGHHRRRADGQPPGRADRRLAPGSSPCPDRRPAAGLPVVALGAAGPGRPEP